MLIIFICEVYNFLLVLYFATVRILEDISDINFCWFILNCPAFNSVFPVGYGEAWLIFFWCYIFLVPVCWRRWGILKSLSWWIPGSNICICGAWGHVDLSITSHSAIYQRLLTSRHNAPRLLKSINFTSFHFPLHPPHTYFTSKWVRVPPWEKTKTESQREWEAAGSDSFHLRPLETR